VRPYAILLAAMIGLGARASHGAEVPTPRIEPEYPPIAIIACTTQQRSRCQRQSQACVNFCYSQFPSNRTLRQNCIQGDDGCRGRAELCYSAAGC
jgi:hypothetical protein